jgi:hypothetical protein
MGQRWRVHGNLCIVQSVSFRNKIFDVVLDDFQAYLLKTGLSRQMGYDLAK